MSSEAVGYAFKYSPHKGATLLVHLAMADVANDLHGDEIWAKHNTIAKKARVSRRSVVAAIAELIASGDLVELVGRVDDDGKPTGDSVRYRFLMPPGRDPVFDPQGVKSVHTHPVQPVHTRVRKPRTRAVQSVHTTTEGKPNGEPNKCADETSPPVDKQLHAMATEFCDFVKVKTDGVTPKFMGVLAAMSAANRQGCTPDEIRSALSVLWRERRITAPSTAMIVELVVRDRVDAPDMPPQSAPTRDVRRCYRDDCMAPVIVGGECIDGHEQPAPELPVKIEEHHT